MTEMGTYSKSINHKLRLLGISTIFTHIPMVRYSRDCGQVYQYKMATRGMVWDSRPNVLGVNFRRSTVGRRDLCSNARDPKYRDSSVLKLYTQVKIAYFMLH